MTAVQVGRLFYAALPAIAIFLWNYPKVTVAFERRDYWDIYGFILVSLVVGILAWAILKNYPIF